MRIKISKRVRYSVVKRRIKVSEEGRLGVKGQNH